MHLKLISVAIPPPPSPLLLRDRWRPRGRSPSRQSHVSMTAGLRAHVRLSPSLSRLCMHCRCVCPGGGRMGAIWPAWDNLGPSEPPQLRSTGVSDVWSLRVLAEPVLIAMPYPSVISHVRRVSFWPTFFALRWASVELGHTSPSRSLGLSCLSYICGFNYLLIQWPAFRAVGWSAGYNGLDRSVALGWSVNGSLHKQQQQLNLVARYETYVCTRVLVRRY